MQEAGIIGETTYDNKGSRDNNWGSRNDDKDKWGCRNDNAWGTNSKRQRRSTDEKPILSNDILMKTLKSYSF